MGEIFDKRNILHEFEKKAPIDIEIGCGPRKKNPDAVGIDIQDHAAVDIVGDAVEVLSRLPDNSVREIYASHVLEHIENPRDLVQQIARVLVVGGVAKIIVPHFSNPFFYSDPTHRIFFGLYTFSYWAQENIFYRRVPTYAKIDGLHLSAIKLVFSSYHPRYFRHAIKKIVEGLVNCTVWGQEFYEENLCYFIPCYELDFEIKKFLMGEPVSL
jgi:predicted SAM-dependent methyltransferase